ncbi:MAG TPA: YidC/Oxa1 family insertase periplasmic-domain containing protein [Blastocatellia bacterium]|nr:YidC/Oxa1 family insertase periplasmic-domain containing protein [Blastocatellia bacterium]
MRLTLALILSMAVLMGWPLIMRYFFPQPERPRLTPPATAGQQAEIESARPAPGAVTAQAPSPAQPDAQSSIQTTQVPPREISVKTDFWDITLSNRGAVATSWILKKDGDRRDIRAANGGPLELIPQEALEKVGAPLRVHLSWSPALALQLNQVNFQIEGLQAHEQEIQIGPGEEREISFIYSSPGLSARKTFRFYGDRLVFDATADVSSNGEQQPVKLVLGPRIGDQTDKQSGNYSTPPQVISYTRAGDREQVLGASITPPFAKIISIDPGADRIEIDKPLAGGVDQVKIVAADGHTFIGYATVTNREANSLALTLDSIPEGAAVGGGVAQATDTLRHNYLWSGVVDHYFSMVALPTYPIGEITLTNIQMKTGQDNTPHDYPSVAVPVRPDSPTRIFVGPKQRELLAAIGTEYGTDLGALIDYGMLAFMVRPLVPPIGWALDGLARLFHNYGWAIVVVTAIINLALSPLRWYSSKKMKKAAKHQPRMKELQERLKKLKENPKKFEREMQQLQQEQLALMKEANPLGGCLPLLLQMPIFWAFFVYLTISLDVRQAPWIGWIKDLSAPDPYYVLPILMCVTMIASTALTPQPASADPSMKMQRIMMTWIMPIMLTWFFFFSAPSGLVLYWMISNVVGVAIQLVINKMTAEPAAADAAVSAGAGKAGGSKSSKKDGTQKRKASDKELIEGAK